jgi:alpha-N-acetylglucosaminidase
MNHSADGDAVVRIYGDGALIYTSPVLRSGLAATGNAAVPVDLDISGVRQLRLAVAQQDANRWFDAVSFGGAQIECTGELPVPLSQGKPATASSAEGSHVAALADDGDLSTNWLCNPKQCADVPAWWQVDLGSVQALSGVRVTPYYADGRSYRYTVQGSVDGATWTDLAAKTATAAQTDVGELYQVAGAFRYVRVTGFGNTSNAYTLHLQELAVYGAG